MAPPLACGWTAGKGRLKEAVKDRGAGAAMNLGPEDGTLYSNRSICWLKMGEGMEALTDAHLCRMLCPDCPKACYREGASHMFLKDYDKACDAFLDGLKLDPGNMEIENGLWEAFKSLKKSRAA
uniref:Uncharacterized protein n=1 Tax=Oryza punctata TaxID=4537 RepID=A0A0E0JZY8_ORYPU